MATGIRPNHFKRITTPLRLCEYAVIELTTRQYFFVLRLQLLQGTFAASSIKHRLHLHQYGHANVTIMPIRRTDLFVWFFFLEPSELKNPFSNQIWATFLSNICSCNQNTVRIVRTELFFFLHTSAHMQIALLASFLH